VEVDFFSPPPRLEGNKLQLFYCQENVFVFENIFEIYSAVWESARDLFTMLRMLYRALSISTLDIFFYLQEKEEEREAELQEKKARSEKIFKEWLHNARNKPRPVFTGYGFPRGNSTGLYFYYTYVVT